MKYLKEFVDRENAWRSLLNYPAIDITTPKGLEMLAATLRGKLSPENLTCDGEVRGAELQSKVRYLERVQKDLIRIDPSFKNYDFYG
jgi:hypothetical protein